MTEAERERAAVVAWHKSKGEHLRQRARSLMETGGLMDAGALVGIASIHEDAAIAIQRGDHLKESGNGE